MNDSTEIILSTPQALPAFSFNDTARELKEAALAGSAFISKVENQEENDLAVAAQTELKRVTSLLESAIKPFIDRLNQAKNQVWRARDDLKTELDAELLRVSRIIGDFQTLQEAKRRAAEAERNKALLAIEREKAAAIAKVTNHDELDAVQAVFNQKAADAIEAIPAPLPIRAKGQVVGKDWDLEILNAYELAKYHPQCVTITHKPGEIKKLLNEGIAVAGVKATEKTVAGVRLKREREAIAV